MITFKTLLETVYEPKSGDEKNFKNKHIVAKYLVPHSHDEAQFTSTAKKAKRKADYDSKEDEEVYEAMDPVGKHDADIDNDGDTDKSDKYLIARRKAIGKAIRKEEVELDEAFKIGAMKLKDGSTVTLTRESVDAFNKLFTQLNSANKAKMEERMLSGKSGFEEILGFAENI